MPRAAEIVVSVYSQGRTAKEIRTFNLFKLVVGLLLLVLATFSLLFSAETPQSTAASITAPTETAPPAPTTRPTTVATAVPPATTLPPTLNAENTTIQVGRSELVFGTAQAGAGVVLKTVNGFVVGSTTADVAGRWEIDVTFETVGTFELMVESSNPADGTQLQSDGLRFTATFAPEQLVPPTIGEMGSAEFLPDSTVQFQGTGTPQTMLGIFINQTLFDAIEVDLDGRWHYRAQFPEQGDYQLFVQTLDQPPEIDLTSPAIKFEIAPDSTPLAESRPTTQPTAIITPTMTSSQPDGEFAGGTIDLSGRANPLHTLEVIVNREAVAWLKPDAAGDWEHRLAFEAPNTYTFFVRSVSTDGSRIAFSQHVTVQLATDQADGDACWLGAFLPDSRYEIAPCETLSSIAERSQTDVETLRALNPQIENPAQLQPGQQLILP